MATILKIAAFVLAVGLTIPLLDKGFWLISQPDWWRNVIGFLLIVLTAVAWYEGIQVFRYMKKIIEAMKKDKKQEEGREEK
jgi:predicted tellurium resistance membrane protein TerC